MPRKDETPFHTGPLGPREDLPGGTGFNPTGECLGIADREVRAVALAVGVGVQRSSMRMSGQNYSRSLITIAKQVQNRSGGT